ncbi:MAG: hypothetical protein ABW321_19855 [Polyangiales bacterium]
MTLAACGGDTAPPEGASAGQSGTPAAPSGSVTPSAGAGTLAAGSGGQGAVAPVGPVMPSAGAEASAAAGRAGEGSGGLGGASEGAAGVAAAAGSGGAVAGSDAAAAGGTAPACDKPAPPAGGDPCSAPLAPGDDRLCEFEFEGETRRFFLYAPSTFNPCQPAAMVLDMHGASESIEVHIGREGFREDSPLGYGSSWRRAVQGDNAIVVTPEGIGLRWARNTDPAFLNAVADLVEKTATVDPEKRYLTGISMGGMITVQTGCENADRWRGQAPVAMLTNTCASLSRPTPAIIFHAMTDSITSYEDSRTLAGAMAALNECQTGPEMDALVFGGPMSAMDAACFATPPKPGDPPAADPTTVPFAMCPSDRPISTCTRWTGCADGVEVLFCTVEAADQIYGGHLLYNNDTGLNLPALAWPFFKKFWK